MVVRCVATRAVQYVYFIIYVFSRTTVGRDVSQIRTSMVLDVIEMARWSGIAHLPRGRCHSDMGSKFTSICSGKLLMQVGAVPSTRSVCEGYDNARVETVNGS